jgi:hypothetical protein
MHHSQQVHIDPRGAELLFQIITERDERASIAVAHREEPYLPRSAEEYKLASSEYKLQARELPSSMRT